jgi:beta-xylosidase
VTIERSLATGTWRDPSASPDERVSDLLAQLTTAEKVAQLYGVWVGVNAASGEVAPYQHDLATPPVSWDELIRDGLGQITRVYGTSPVTPAEGALAVARSQRQIMAAGRHGIPAMVHEECLTGLAAWQATVYPSPLCWGATFDPDLIERMGAQIGATMRRLGVHQGLAPVLDVLRDLRWGRAEETIGEDPHLVGMIGSGYVRGLESAGVVATLKHFAGYSASRGGRNLAPVSVGPRELADVLLPPFEMALRAGARSVMNSYTDLDGVPTAADASLLTTLLRDTYGFTGTVVSDYFSVAFLRTLHGVAATRAEAAGLALRAGIDVELPTVDCYGDPLQQGVESGAIDIGLVDRAVRRVLTQKCELGLLDPDWSPDSEFAGPGAPAPGDGDLGGALSSVLDRAPGSVLDRAPGNAPGSAPNGASGSAPNGASGSAPSNGALDDSESRSLAREIARRSIVLLANQGTLPLAGGQRIAVVGPRADQASAMLGCYSFPQHVGVQHPGVPMGIEVATVLDALRNDPAGYGVSYAEGCPVLGGEDTGLAAAAAAAAAADVCVAVLGDLAGLFGRGTSGEGCDAADLRLPGRQEDLLEAVLATGTPVVLVLLAGRPYDLSRQADRLAGAVCGFYPGEEGAAALADVLSGRVNPSGRLPVSFPGAGSNQPGTYLAAPLGQYSRVSNVDPTPVFPFGHGLSYAPVTWVSVRSCSPPLWPADGSCQFEVTIRNSAAIASAEVIQVYLHDPVAEVARPVQQLIAAAKVDLPPGSSRTVRFRLHADLTCYTGAAGHRQVDPGQAELRVGRSSTDIEVALGYTLTGPRRAVGFGRVLHPEVTLLPAD